MPPTYERCADIQCFAHLQHSWNSAYLGRDVLVRLEETACVFYDLVDALLRIFPRIDRHLGVRGEASDLHRHLVWVCGYVVGRYKQWRLACTNEIANVSL